MMGFALLYPSYAARCASRLKPLLQNSVQYCMELMTERRLRHLPVLAEGELIGLLSIGDLVKETIAEQADLIRQLEQYIRGEIP